MSARSRSELRVDERIVGPEPVAEAPAHELFCRGRGGALHDVVLAVEEVRRVLGIGGHRLESLKRSEDRRGPFPTVAHEVVNAPRARASRTRARGNGIPREE